MINKNWYLADFTSLAVLETENQWPLQKSPPQSWPELRLGRASIVLVAFGLGDWSWFFMAKNEKVQEEFGEKIKKIEQVDGGREEV